MKSAERSNLLRNLVVATTAAGLLAAAWYLPGIGGAQRAEDEPAREAVASELAEGAPEPALAIPAAAPEQRSRVAPMLDQPPVETPTPSASEAELVRGTIVVRDAAGREYPSEDGFLLVGDWDDLEEVSVTGGVFEFADTAGVRVSPASEPSRSALHAAQLGGRVTLLDERPALRAGEAHTLTASWPPRTLLRVVSEGDGRELDGIDVCGDFDRLTLRAAPGPWWEDRTVARGAPSPVALPPPAHGRVLHENEVRTYFVRAAGHAWRPVLLNLTEGGTTTVALPAGGDIRVFCEGLQPARPPELVLKPRAPAPASELAEPTGAASARRALPAFDVDAAGVGHCASVPAGGWLLEALVETPFDTRHVVASAELVVRAGEETRVDLTLDMPPPVLHVPLAGTLVVPAAYGLGAPTLAVRSLAAGAPPRYAGVADLTGFDEAMLAALALGASARVLEDLEPVEGEPDTWRWDAGRVPAGHVEASVPGTGYAQGLDIGNTGEQHLGLVCPPPIEVELILVDELDGTPLTAEGVLPVLPVGGSLWDVDHYAELEADRENTAYLGRLAPGRYLLGLWEGRFAEYFAHFEVVSGSGLIRVPVNPTSQVRLLLTDGGAPVAPPVDLVASVEREDGTAVRICGVSLNLSESPLEAGLLVGLAGHGALRLHLRAPAGFEPLEPVRLDVARGGTAELTLELERRD